MMQQQADDLVRCQIIAATVHAADPVGVAIGHQADVVRMFFEKRLAARIILQDRLGIDAAKKRVVIAIERGDLAGGAGEQLLETTRAHAKERVMRETQSRFRDELEVHQFFERGVMRRSDIGDLYPAIFDGVGQRQVFDRMAAQEAFNRLARFRIARTAVIRLEFETVENRRIVAGGNHHAADGAQIFDGERNRRRRRRFGREHDLKMISGQDFGGDLRKPVGKKTPVIADNNFVFRFPLSAFRFPIIRRRLCDARDVGKSEIFRDDRAPAVRAKFNLCHGAKIKLLNPPVRGHWR